ncbi:hypothetical protein PINS_up009465 [Pythium insidiosum]|nr:hypothetical protein PINS_up009465 [Pythium insidiosum]
MTQSKAARRACVFGPWGYRALWTGVVALHAVCVVFPCLVASLYLYLPTHAPRIVKNAELYSVSVNRKYYKLIAAVYFAIAAIHIVMLASIVGISFRYRCLLLHNPSESFGPKIKAVSVRAAAGSSQHSEGATQSARSDSRFWSYTQHVVSSAKVVWSAFDVTNGYYDIVHILREIVETALLSYQAYQTSYLVPQPWMNNVLVLLLFLNCWSMPLIRSRLARQVYTARLLGLLVNLALDLMAYMVVPLIVFLPFYRVYETMRTNSTNDFWYTDRWLMRVVTEWRLLFIGSFWDAVSTFFIALSITRSLMELPKLVQPRDAVLTRRISSVVPHSLTPQQTYARKALALAVEQLGSKRTWLMRSSLSSNNGLVIRRVLMWERVGRWLLVMWGVVIAAVHVYASSHGTNHQCLIQVRPWLARRAACSLMEINCKHNAVRGDASDFRQALAGVDTEWISYLIIRHCSHVEITTEFNALRNLVGLKIFNSTLAAWDASAALTQAHHPAAMFVFLVEVNMSEVPAGLYARDFPKLLTDVEICRSNVTSLPPAVASSWPNGLFLLLEAVNFREFPTVITTLEPRSLSLAMNTFESVPAQVFENRNLEWIKLNGNPITALPSAVALLPPLRFLFVEATRIEAIPTWMDLSALFVARAGGSPLCHTLQADSTGATRLARELVNCTPPATKDELYHFPVGVEHVINP